MKATSTFAERVVRARNAARLKLFAEKVVQEAMKSGLEWAVKNPRAFLQDSGAVIDGSSLTADEQDVVVQVLQRLLDRLLTEVPLWGRKTQGTGMKKGQKTRRTIEREAAEAGARRGW